MPVPLREILPGYQVLDCHRLRAALSPDACRDNFTNGKTLACLGCPVGAEFAGRTATPERQHAKFRIAGKSRAASISTCLWRRCIRCQRPAARLIASAYCPSCWNRTLELRRGRNAKGAWSAKTAQ